MNTPSILQDLREAHEQLTAIISEMEKTPSYSEHDLQATLGHVYHHLNTAWNGRHASIERHRECCDTDFETWRKFPANEELMLD